MTNFEFWEALNGAVDKDGYGGVFDPTDYEDISRVVNLSFLKRKMEELYKSIQPREDLQKTIYSSKLFRNLIIRETLTPSSGIIDLSSDLSDTYGFFIGLRVTSTNVKIKLIPNEELDEVLDNAILTPSTSYPVATIDGDNLRINPTSITSVIFTYIKIPDEPIFDYYSDSNDNIVYMAEGATSVSIPSGATYSDGTEGPTTKDSQSIEFDYNETFHPELFSEILELLANRLRDQPSAILAQTKMSKEEMI